jgi:hypothetical protein
MPQTKVYDTNVSDKERMAELGKQTMLNQVAGQAVRKAAPRYLEQGAMEGYQAGTLDEAAKWKSALLPLRADQQYQNAATGGTQFPQPVPQFNSLSEKAAYEQRMNGGM